MGFNIDAVIEVIIHEATQYSVYIFELCCLAVMLWGGYRPCRR